MACLFILPMHYQYEYGTISVSSKYERTRRRYRWQGGRQPEKTFGFHRGHGFTNHKYCSLIF